MVVIVIVVLGDNAYVMRWVCYDVYTAAVFSCVCQRHIHHGSLLAVALIGPNPLPCGRSVLLNAITGSRYQVSFCYQPG